MKKMLLATLAPAYLQDVAQQTFTGQNKPAAVALKPLHHFFVSGIGQKENSMQPICGGAEMLLGDQQTFVNGLLGFITLGIYISAGSACVCHNNCMSCPSIWATLSAH